LKIIVEDGKAPEEIFSIKLCDLPVTASDEEVQVDEFLLQRDVLSFVESGYLRKPVFSWGIQHSNHLLS